MGLFNWLSWQLERRVIMKEMDRLRADLAESEEQLLYAKRDIAELRSDLGEVEQLLHEAQVGAKLAAEEQDKLKTRSVIETTEPAESELERKAWELWLRGDDSIEGVWRKAELWLHARESKRNEQENQNNGPF